MKFYNKLEIFKESNTEKDRLNMAQSRTEYRREVTRCRYQQMQGDTKKLLNAKTNNVKEYWKLLKKGYSAL